MISRGLLGVVLLTALAGCGSPSRAPEPVRLGIDVLMENPRITLGDRKVGLLTHSAAIDRELRASVDRLSGHPDVRLAALFSPEHGMRGSAHAGEKVDGEKDPVTGLPVHSLYGKTKKPTPEMLSDIDVLVVDLQDIGSRSYTYISTLYYAMEAAAENGKAVIVLDRPNPMGGLVVDGPVLDPKFKSFIGVAPIPVVHGMTIGELAWLFNAEFGIHADLRVIEMRGWKRTMAFRETGLYWAPPSPHIPTPETVFYYPITGLIGEMGTLSEGVGTPMPFHLVGAPWMDGQKLAAALPPLRGCAFRPITVKPFYARYAGENVHGVQIFVTQPMYYRPVEISVYLLHHIRNLWPDQFRWYPPDEPARLENVDRAWGTDFVRKWLDEGKTPDRIISEWRQGLKKFLAVRQKHLIYD
ncbi:DUF1343 domain-containing protein [bacterium]|nr:DUF1343 domain-containing protein [bacterium]